MNVTTKNGGMPDMNGEGYGGDEEAGSGDDSDDVGPTSSVIQTSAYCRAIPAGCRNHHGACQSLARFPVRPISAVRRKSFIKFTPTASGTKTALNQGEQARQGCL
jgi:hypothetical protein